MRHDQNFLNDYFANIWSQRTNPIDKFPLSGKSLINKIKPTETVIDVGCGKNLYKPFISNLIGVDPAFIEADVKCTIEDYITDIKFDVALCLGSINFGTEEVILRQINKVQSLLKSKSRIYWRCNPGRQDHDNDDCKQINFYPWTIEKHLELSKIFNFRVIECRWENKDRLYAEWSR